VINKSAGQFASTTALWLCNDASGATTLVDSVGGFTATIHGTITCGLSDAFGNFVIGATSAYASIASACGLTGSTDMFLEAVYYQSNDSTSTTYQPFIEVYSTGTTRQSSIHSYNYNNIQGPGCQIFDTGASAHSVNLAYQPMGGLHHQVLVSNFASKKLSLYLDGVLIGSVTFGTSAASPASGNVVIVGATASSRWNYKPIYLIGCGNSAPSAANVLARYSALIP